MMTSMILIKTKKAADTIECAFAKIICCWFLKACCNLGQEFYLQQSLSG